MSLLINNLVVHKLVKNELSELELEFSSGVLDNSPDSEMLISELHRKLSERAKGYAQFKDDSYFSASLTSLSSDTFFDFSKVASKRLCEELEKYPFADDGFIILSSYSLLATEYLLVALVGSNSSISIKSGLELTSSAHLDLGGADLVARINLTDLQLGQSKNREIAFAKGRVGRKISDFFLDFMEAETGLDASSQSKVLVQAISDFTSHGELEKDEVNSIKKSAHSYCKDQINAGDDVNIVELSSELEAVSGVTFAEFTKERGYDLEDAVPASTKDLKRLTKYVGAGGGLNVSFDSILLGERIFYDPETDTLTIKGTPPNLRHSLTSK